MTVTAVGYDPSHNTGVYNKLGKPHLVGNEYLNNDNLPLCLALKDNMKKQEDRLFMQRHFTTYKLFLF